MSLSLYLTHMSGCNDNNCYCCKVGKASLYQPGLEHYCDSSRVTDQPAVDSERSHTDTAIIITETVFTSVSTLLIQ